MTILHALSIEQDSTERWSPYNDIHLTTTECIIVDDEKHEPYILLSPSGVGKISSKYGTSLQQTQVQYEEEIDFSSSSSQQDDVMRRLISTSKRLFVFLFKVGIGAYMLGFGPNQHLKENWIKYLILFIVGFHSYVVFVPNIPLIRFGYPSAVQEKVVKIVVNRTRDFEYITSGKPNWYMVLYSNLENTVKDLMVYTLTFLPSVQLKLYDEMEKQKNCEIEEFTEMVTRLYYMVPSPYRNIESALEAINDEEDPEVPDAEIRERKFNLLAEYFQLLSEYNS
ncbi:hypothetical protein KGF56_000251 [Candida oxycetoniae]|uniref:Uncharacterized protein n=1 Tax=Candida oxycetoniae TaxID=497107 RepID=A0AAI9T149_9ASCO|nr:uncharacterized protein KGF56_000251 [Candida oxycetoniae]KAI3406958.2 hypothetical protein KGF56_000251 [Candida oxycetoniae]